MAKRYIENNLNKNEHVVLEAKISWLTLVPSFIWLVLMFVVAFVLLGKIEVEDKYYSQQIDQPCSYEQESNR